MVVLILLGTVDALAVALHDGREVPFVVVVIVAVSELSTVQSAGRMNWLLSGEGMVLVGMIGTSAVTFPVVK